MKDTPPYIFWPREIGPYDAEIHRLLIKLHGANGAAEAREIATEHLNLLPSYRKATLPYMRYRAYLLVLLDLLQQGWGHICKNGRLYLSPPAWSESTSDPATIREQKQAIRQALSYERLAQMQKPAVQRFITKMEQPRAHGCHVVSIRSLFADGRQLAQDLEAVAQLETKAAQKEVIRSVIQPYLQLVTPDERCPHTGLRLNDIWRYMRYTWSIPYNSTPGRNMFYLVRDAARPFHPIIGIAALGNSLVQITARDDAIGWTSRATFERILADTFTEDDAARVAAALRTTLHAAIGDIATDDLITDAEVTHPSEVTLKQLEQIENEARAQRISLLQQRRTMQDQPDVPAQQLPLKLNGTEKSQTAITEIEHQATASLFRAKRARALRLLLGARKTLQGFTENLSSIAGLRAFIHTEEGQQSVRTLIRENKKRKIGINMMDIITCGAIPPYNPILGGKLVAMLMCSPEVVKNYREKYKGYTSHIASKMKQEDVYREPDLVFLGTTSLYHVGSSQYNRIAIPIKGKNRQLKYEKLGKTLGYGSVHFSQQTVQALKDLQVHEKQATLINNRFGEGVNPKLRQVSAGLYLIGLENADHFTKHRSQRIVYGVALGENSYEYLRGETDDPGYYFDLNSPKAVDESTHYIIEYWLERWLLMRIRKKRILAQVASFDIEGALLSDTNQSMAKEETTEGSFMNE